MNVSLLQLEPEVRRRVKVGEFANASEFIRHCVRVTLAIEKRHGPAGASFVTQEELKQILAESFASERRPLNREAWDALAAEAAR